MTQLAPDDDWAPIAERFAQKHHAVPAAYVDYRGPFVAGLRPNRRQQRVILDLGCGPGRDLRWLAADADVAIGADGSIAMLRQWDPSDRDPLRVAMDMRQIGFRESSLSGVWCSAALHHLRYDEASRVLRQIHRACVPGAPLFVSVQHGAGEHHELREGRNVLFARYSLAQLADVLTGAGFRVEAAAIDAGAIEWVSSLAVADRQAV